MATKTKKQKGVIGVGDFFRMYAKPSLNGRVVFRKRGARRKSDKVIQYNDFIRRCFSGKERGPMVIAKALCYKEHASEENFEYTCSNIKVLRTYLSRVLKEIRDGYDKKIEKGETPTCPGSVSGIPIPLNIEEFKNSLKSRKE